MTGTQQRCQLRNVLFQSDIYTGMEISTCWRHLELVWKRMPVVCSLNKYVSLFKDGFSSPIFKNYLMLNKGSWKQES